MCSKFPGLRAIAIAAIFVVLVAAEALAATVKLDWSNTSTSETGFKIERMLAGGSYSQIAIVDNSVQSYLDSSAVEGSSYCYRVSAYNSYGTSSHSNIACVHIPNGSSGLTTLNGTDSIAEPSDNNTVVTADSYIGSKWKNYQLSALLRPQNKGHIGLMFRYQNNDSYYRLLWDADTQSFRLERRVGGVLKVLASHTGSLQAGEFHRVDISANGSQITVSVNDNKLFSLTDSTIGEGHVALYTASSASAAFASIVVSDLQTGNVLLQDYFSSTELSGWTILDEAPNGPSSWSVSNGVLVQESAIGSNSDGNSLGTFALYTRGSWTNYRFSLAIDSTEEDMIGIMFHVKDAENYFRFSWDKREGLRRLEKRINGELTTLAADTDGYHVGRDYQLTILAQNTHIQVLVDGQLVFSVVDPALNGGTVALYSRRNPSVVFYNVLVEDLEKTLILLWDEFNDYAAGWTAIDDYGAEFGPSNWSVANGGTLAQNDNINSNGSGQLGTFVVY